jgi:hypothetical protein
VHNKAQILCPGIIHLSLKKMDRAKGRQTNKKEADKGPLADLMSSYLHENGKYCSTLAALT